jgi:putative intracellular protease/amidase/uncharacterized protein (DUF952 family)
MEWPRWIYHLVPRADVPRGDLAPASLEREGFVHGSFRDEVAESARLHFPRSGPEGSPMGSELVAIPIDPRRAGVRIELATTPRGPMPHLHGVVPADALGAPIELADLASAPDRVLGTRFAFVAFSGMTLLDLVGVLDPVSRIASMGFDPTATCTVIAADTPEVWTHHEARLAVATVRPPLDAFDVVVVAGGHGTRALEHDPEVVAWLTAYPSNRVLASVCTGSLLLGAAGRLRGVPATSHRSALPRLAELGAVITEGRVVDAWPIVTAGGVTCGLDLGMHLVRRLAGDEVAGAIATQMQLPGR